MFLMFLTCATVSMRCCLHTDHIPRSLWECLERVVVPFISSRRKLCCAPDHLGLPGVLSKDGAIQCHRLVVCMLMVFDSCKHDALVASDLCMSLDYTLYIRKNGVVVVVVSSSINRTFIYWPNEKPVKNGEI